MNQLLCLVWLFEEELDNGRHKLQLNLGVLVLSNSVGLVTASLLLFFTAIQWGYFNDMIEDGWLVWIKKGYEVKNDKTELGFHFQDSITVDKRGGGL